MREKERRKGEREGMVGGSSSAGMILPAIESKKNESDASFLYRRLDLDATYCFLVRTLETVSCFGLFQHVVG